MSPSGDRLSVAITGATGYVGGRLVRHLRGEIGASVRILARDPTPSGNVAVDDVVVGDLDSGGSVLDRLCRGVDTLIHLAGPNEVRAVDDPVESIAGLPAGTLRLAGAASRGGVRRIVYLSTVHVYGGRLRSGDVVTEETPCEPRAAYAIARLASEHVLAAFGPGDLVVLRLTNSVGAPAAASVDRWTLVANDLCRQGAVAGELRLRTDGTQWRDFVPLSDVVRIIGGVARANALSAGTYNLGSGRPLTVRSLAGIVQDAFEIAGRPRPPLHAREPKAEPQAPPVVSVDRLAQAGFGPTGTVEAAVAETVAFCLDHRQELAAAQR